ncbi:MAG: cation:H+ antiporter [Halieaceae bacterium]|jgi:cation:H+ antiporter
MLIPLLTVIAAFAVLVWSADLFVAGAASIAENAGMSPVVIGLTIVSLGTSAPEILVSITAALDGASGLAVGNAVGSNIANIGLVLGIALLVTPMKVHPGCARTELPTLLVVTAGTGILLLDVELDRGDAIMMITALALIMMQMMRTQVADPELAEASGEEEEELPHLKPARAWSAFATGLLLLIGSSKLLVWGASEIAFTLGVPELVIGLTVVAVGTSLPELAATVASSMRGHSEIAMGNIIGSNLFNLLAVMAMPGLLAPGELPANFLVRDYGAMCVATLILAGAVYLGRYHSRALPGGSYLGRGMGSLLCLCYALYYYWLFQTV